MSAKKKKTKVKVREVMPAGVAEGIAAMNDHLVFYEAGLKRALKLLESLKADGAVRLPYNGYNETIGALRDLIGG